MMPQFDLLGTLMRDLHYEFVKIYYLLLPVFFMLSIAVTWFRAPHGSIEFLNVLKRAIISTFLLAAFPEISQAIVFVADGITEKIDNMNTIDTMIRMAQEKSQGYSFSATSILLQFNDLIIAALSFLSFLVLYVARYITIAMYHFFWIFYMVTAPLLLLFNLFSSTQKITVNLFKGMIEVACWKIVWAILGAMLTALSFGNAYRTEGNYLTLMVMNFIIAIAMLSTPLLVRSLVGGGLESMSTLLGTTAVAAMVAAPARAGVFATTSRNVISNTSSFARNGFAKLKRSTFPTLPTLKDKNETKNKS
jgi:hypothetical protein